MPNPLNFLVSGLLAAAGVATGESVLYRHNTTSHVGSQCACSQLGHIFGNLTIAKGAPGYAYESTNFWDKRCNLLPTCIFMPNSAEQVAKAVGIFNDCDAPFAVRGGGHMNFPGSNNINDGVLLALNGLDHVQVDKNEESLEVGPGNTWVDVYSALAPYGRYAIGGRLKTIGVPGLTLIGGVGYFLNKYGFSMDNVISYDIVLGNGTQVVASQDSNPDLFWALKGGAGNYGIVTKFVMRTYDIPVVSSTYQIFDESQAKAFIAAACKMALSDDGSVGAGAVINMNYNTTTRTVTPQVFGLQEGNSIPPSRFASFTDIPAVARMHNVTEPSVWHSQFETPNQMFRIAFDHHTIRPDADQLHELYKLWHDAIEDIVDVEGLLPTFVLNLVPRSAATVAKTNGIGNTFGLDNDESYIWFQLATSWAREEDDLRVTAWSRMLIERLHEMNKKKGLATDFIYMGDAGEHQSVFEHYGQNNIDKMKDIRDAYDPNLVFTRLNSGGFKLGY